MRCLCIFIQEPLLVTELEYQLTDCIELNGNIYRKQSVMDNEVVFYDWIFDQTGIIRGLEIHLSPDEPVLQPLKSVNKKTMIETDYFVRLWLSGIKDGEPQGLEAFGDLFFFLTVDHQLCIIVGIDSWLPPSQSNQLISLSRKR